MLCGNCKKEILDGSKFCEFCGSPVAQPPVEPQLQEPQPIQQPPQPQAFPCPHCGTTNPQGAAFCTNCGGPIAGAFYSPVPPYAPPQPKKSGGMVLAIVLASVGALAALAAVFIFIVAPRLNIDLFGSGTPATSTDLATIVGKTTQPAKATSKPGNANAALDAARADAANGDYAKAIQGLLDLTGKDAQDPATQELLASIKAEYRKNLKTKADAAVASTSYETAFQLYQDALSKFPDDAELTADYAAYQSAYIDSIQALGGSMRQQYQYNESEALVQNALTLLPGNERLQALLESYQGEQIARSLFDISPSNQMIMHETFEYWYDGERSDCFGNYYTRGIYFEHYYKSSDTDFHSDLTYELNGEYRRLTGVFGTDSTCSKSSYNKTKDYALLEIYGDGKLLTATPKCRGNTSVVNIDVDVTGVTTLKLVVRCYAIDPDLFDFVIAR